MFILACGGDKIVVWFLGSEWETAGNVALCLSLWSFPTILTQPLIPLFRALNSQRYLLLFDVMYFICGIGSILVCCQFIDNLFVILIVYAVVCAIVKLMMFMKIIKLGNVYMASWMRVLPLWLISCVILLFRLLSL
jgi:O-antigen/teichoic acid export membrane protein